VATRKPPGKNMVNLNMFSDQKKEGCFHGQPFFFKYSISLYVLLYICLVQQKPENLVFEIKVFLYFIRVFTMPGFGSF
jgi:hypothetical protein